MAPLDLSYVLVGVYGTTPTLQTGLVVSYRCKFSTWGGYVINDKGASKIKCNSFNMVPPIYLFTCPWISVLLSFGDHYAWSWYEHAFTRFKSTYDEGIEKQKLHRWQGAGSVIRSHWWAIFLKIEQVKKLWEYLKHWLMFCFFKAEFCPNLGEKPRMQFSPSRCKCQLLERYSRYLTTGVAQTLASENWCLSWRHSTVLGVNSEIAGLERGSNTLRDPEKGANGGSSTNQHENNFVFKQIIQYNNICCI